MSDSFFDKFQEHDHDLRRQSTGTSIGIVSDAKLDPKIGPVVRLTFPDRDGKVSAWTPYAQHGGTIGTASYKLPRVGERVLVHHLHNGPESGVAVGAIYSTAVSAPPQSGDPKNTQTTFDDGSTMMIKPMEAGGGAAEMSMIGPVKVSAGGLISLTANATISITGGGTITITSGSLVHISAPTINLNGIIIDSAGNASFPGNVSTQGNSTTNGNQSVNGSSSVSGNSFAGSRSGGVI
jgi:phage baseplate assembly protein V